MIFFILVGNGSFGAVHLCTHKSQMDNKLVMKITELKNVGNKELDSCMNEVNLLKSMHHPNIVQLFDSFITEDKSEFCIVMVLFIYFQIIYFRNIAVLEIYLNQLKK